MKDAYDFIVIGGGSAGYNAARLAADLGLEVAVIDGSRELGGLCILRGCMPSKTLIYSAEVLHLAKQAGIYGLDVPEARADMPALHRRKLEVIGEFAAYRAESLENGPFDLFRNQAAFVAEDAVRLDDGRELKGSHFLVATGSIPSSPPVPGLDAEGVWTSDEVLDLDFLPESVLVLGGGVVACELAQYLVRIGSPVVQIQRSPRILKEQAPEVSETVAQAFRDDGIELLAGTQLQRVERTAEGFKAVFEMDGQTRVREARHLLNALGREPATRALGLEKAGVRLRKSGHIETDAFQRSSNPRVYAAGDCAGPYEIVHIAILQGEVAARHAAGRNPEPVNYDHRLEVIFTDPQVARVGLSQAELEARNLPFASASHPFDDHGKSILMEAKRGFVRLFAARSDGALLGAEIVGKDAGELVHALSVAVSHQLSAASLLRTHWYHPTLSEIVTYPLEEIVEQLGKPRPERPVGAS